MNRKMTSSLPGRTTLLALAISFTASSTHAQIDERTVEYRYHPNGQIEQIDGPRNDIADITEYHYDSAGNRIAETNALGHQIHWQQHNTNGNPNTRVDANGVITEFTYDLNGATVAYRLQDPNNLLPSLETRLTLDDLGQVTQLDTPAYGPIELEYDHTQRLISVTNALGERIQLIRDIAGEITHEHIQDANGTTHYSRQHTLDELGRELNSLGAMGQRTHNTYDANGNPLVQEDGLNHATFNTFDELNRLQQQLDPLLNTTQYRYDAQGNLTTVTDAQGLTTRYAYNAFDELITQHSPDTGTTTFTYDNAGNQTNSTDANGTTAHYRYDAINRLTDIHYPNNTHENITYTYDQTHNHNPGIGRLTQIDDASGTTSLHYTYWGALSAKTYDIADQDYSLTYGYDNKSRIIRTTYPSGRLVHYTRNTLGHITQIHTQKDENSPNITLVTNIQYLPFGPVKSLQYGNGLIQNIEYDQSYRITQIENHALSPIANINYTYDLNNNIITQHNTEADPPTQIFEYDPLNRIITAEGGYGALDFLYDAVGNRTQKTHQYNGNTQNHTYTYPAESHRLSHIDIDNNGQSLTRQFTYDANGNQLTDTLTNNTTVINQTHRTYGESNRPTQTHNTGDTLDYRHNALGQRTLKRINGKETHFHYNEAGQLIAVTTGTGATTTEHLFLGSIPIAVFIAGQTDTIPEPPVIEPLPLLDLGILEPYIAQDRTGTATNSTDGHTLTLTGNRWLSTTDTFTVTENTLLTFDFSSDQLGEIHGIGFEDDDSGSPDRIFKLAGTQNWAIQDIRYQGGTQRMTIPVGQYYTGSNMRLVFVNDNDAAPHTSSSTFANVTVCEAPCGAEPIPATAYLNLTSTGPLTTQDRLGTVTPNAEGDTLTLTGNRWRTSLEKFDITEDTILEFTFSSDQLGEIQGIGFSENDRGASHQIFKLTGTQNWGIQDIHYQGGTQRMTIPVGQYYTGSNMRLVFVNDNDAAPTSTSTFSHVHVCKTICTDGMIDSDKGTGTEIGTETNEPQAQVGYFVHSDHLATPYMLTNADQQVVWRIENQTPFGEGQINSDPDGNGERIEFNLRFPGQYFDSETGTNYNYFRDYDPSLGRYVQSDPIGLQGGLNTYAYVLGNPLMYIDPLGLFPAPWCTRWQIILGTCPDVGDDIKPEDVPEEWVKEKLKEWEGKPCSAVESSCKRALGPGCYGSGTPCLVPCEVLKQRCEEEKDKLKEDEPKQCDT